ncbi:Hypothetical predicted protein [Octopus vulgaris]|uniref:Uncharacterized protein n=1 Tax=Octopus vulgaris TaxID=6645 RepID=A0AA36FJ84_OCTVU|nr:Hypothetical predicted protein [Octopus vulgaris]
MELNTILETKRPVLHRVMTQLKVNSFNDQDFNLMKEYVKALMMATAVKANADTKMQQLFDSLQPNTKPQTSNTNDAGSISKSGKYLPMSGLGDYSYDDHYSGEMAAEFTVDVSGSLNLQSELKLVTAIK